MKKDDTKIPNEEASVINKVVNDGDDGIKQKKSTRFKKGNKIGVRFGQGQSIVGNGRPLGGPSLVKQAMRLYEANALSAAQLLLEKALDRDADPKTHFAWFKELNHRILGAVKGSAEDVIAQLNEKMENALSLSRSALEATAMGDAERLIKELHKQGILDKVVEKVKGEEFVE